MIDPKEVLALCEKATPGPWELIEGGFDCQWECGRKYGDPDCQREEECEHYVQTEPAGVTNAFTVDCGDFMGLDNDNALFITTARTALPQLAQRVIELEETNESIRNWNACEEHLHKTLLAENAKLKAVAAVAYDACEELEGHGLYCISKLRGALAAAGYGGGE